MDSPVRGRQDTATIMNFTKAKKKRRRVNKMKKQKENILEKILMIVAMLIVIVLFTIAYNRNQNGGYYAPTETMQADGSYYIWVEE